MRNKILLSCPPLTQKLHFRFDSIHWGIFSLMYMLYETLFILDTYITNKKDQREKAFQKF